jgi:uncharacterized protein (TIGR01440 family)
LTYDEIKNEAAEAVKELLETADLKAGSIFVVGCSSSEIKGESIGKGSDINAAEAVYEGIKPVLDERGIYLAAQCCEHLNRAIIIERAAMKPWQEICNVVPQIHAGGSFATTCYKNFDDPVALEHIRADAGIDIGDTLIGMHLRDVAVPVRIKTKQIGEAHVVCARTRPKYIGGERAVYDQALSGGEVRDN